MVEKGSASTFLGPPFCYLSSICVLWLFFYLYLPLTQENKNSTCILYNHKKGAMHIVEITAVQLSASNFKLNCRNPYLLKHHSKSFLSLPSLSPLSTLSLSELPVHLPEHTYTHTHTFYFFWRDLYFLWICMQCRRPSFNPWVGKIPWRRA